MIFAIAVEVRFMKHLKQVKIPSICEHIIWQKSFNPYKKHLDERNILSLKYLHVSYSNTYFLFVPRMRILFHDTERLNDKITKRNHLRSNRFI
jgi:hypothetical protein